MKEALTIAKCILALSQPDKGDVVTNLKLQKLLYYAQGYHLALYGKRLFKEDLEAWQYGPVVPSVYHQYKSNGSSGIILNEENFNCKDHLDQQQLELIQEIYDVYGQFSALKLMDMTHSETPWKTTPTGTGEVISESKLIDFFKTQIVSSDGEK